MIERVEEIEKNLSEQKSSDTKKVSWKISIIDDSEGIRDEFKKIAFDRYLKSSKKTFGLGLSIVYALVVDRYKGKIVIRNRIADDYLKGTVVEFWLQGA